jgi:hypothetical protein
MKRIAGQYEIRKVMFYIEDDIQNAMSFPLSEEGKFDCYGIYLNVTYGIQIGNLEILQEWMCDFPTLEQAETFILERQG